MSLVCLVAMGVKAMSDNNQFLIWSVEGNGRVMALTLPADGQATIASDGKTIGNFQFDAAKIYELFAAGGSLLDMTGELLALNRHQEDGAAELRKLGGSRQSSEITTRLLIEEGSVQGSIQIVNLPALIATIGNRQLAEELRRINALFGEILSGSPQKP